MKPEQQRIAIAQACGWTQISKGSHYDNAHKVYGEPPPLFVMSVPANRGHACTELPDYLNDLNTLHEAETSAKLFHDNATFDLWCRHLFRAVEDCGLSGTTDRPLNRAIAKATAAQHAEAFLRTFNLWVD